MIFIILVLVRLIEVVSFRQVLVLEVLLRYDWLNLGYNLQAILLKFIAFEIFPVVVWNNPEVFGAFWYSKSNISFKSHLIKSYQNRCEGIRAKIIAHLRDTTLTVDLISDPEPRVEGRGATNY